MEKVLIFFAVFFWRVTNGYFADWSVLTRDREPQCVAIPKNLSLCHNIGYTKMRLPNLLEHDTMQEVSQQAGSWVPLLNIKCHEDTQLFLCSLFAPVCLERPIYPCRSLCQKVKSGCEGTMKNYGFPWPSMLDCDKFPLDNDMCIVSQSENSGKKDKKKNKKKDKKDKKNNHKAEISSSPVDKENKCKSRPCNQQSTYDNILSNYCDADFVVKMKFRRIKGRSLNGRKVKTVFKTWRGTPNELRKLRKPRLKLGKGDECCSDWIRTQRRKQSYLLMGKKEGNDLVPTLILPWTKKQKELRRARRAFKQIDCNNNND